MSERTFFRGGDAVSGFLFYLVLAATLFVYWPGLSGIFLLDDIPNLGVFERFESYAPLDRFLAIVTSGAAGAIGRPLAYASFFIDDHSWPTDPAPFLYTNLMIHLLNGCLVFWLVRLISGRMADLSQFQANLVALVAAALWLLHPLNTSTVLYVVQRMTELSSAFMLVGLVIYVKGRLHLRDSPVAAYILMSGGIAIGIGLGALVKEIAVMLPVYVFAIEGLLRANDPTLRSTNPARAWQGVFLCLPLAFVAFWIIHRWSSFSVSYDLREFSLIERLLTEPRIVLEYLGSILFPNRAGTGLFQDDIPISTSLTDPISTLYSVAGIILLVVLAVLLIRKLTALSFAIFWFLGGHLLESTVLPLELAFEHRNYVPMLGPLVAVAYYLSRLADLRLRGFAAFTGLALVSLSAFATWNNANVWGNPLLLANTWAREHPGSIRAQTFAAGHWEQRGAYGMAKELLDKLVTRRPDSTSAHMSRMLIECKLKLEIPDGRIQKLTNHFHTAPKDTAAPESIRNMLIVKKDTRCGSYSLDNLLSFTNALLSNDNYKYGSLRRNLHIAEAELYWAKRQYSKTVQALNNALDYDKNDLRISEILAYVHASAGNYNLALDVIDKVEVKPVLGRKPEARTQRIREIKRQLKFDQLNSDKGRQKEQGQ